MPIVPTETFSTTKEEGESPVLLPDPGKPPEEPLPPRERSMKVGPSPASTSMAYSKIDQPDLCPVMLGVCCCAFFVFLFSALAILFAHRSPKRMSGEYTDWAVVVDAKECSNVSREILDKGGAIGDVAVAILLCMGVTAPHLAGLGGGFIALFYNETSKQVRALDSIGLSPSLTTKDTFASNLALYKSGATAAIVPGAMAGYELIHKELGMLEWYQLFDPAIRLATEGFAIGPHFARSLQRHRAEIEAHADLKSRFWKHSGNRLLQENDTLKQQALADLLSDIAIHGGRFFYEGGVATDIADNVRSAGGLITKDDLSDYKAEWTEPITVDLPYDLVFHSARSPGSGALLGAAVAQTAPNYALNPLQDPHAGIALSAQELHRLVETLKFVYARRSELGDEQEARNMEKGLVDEIVDKFNKTFNHNHPLRSAEEYGLKRPFAEDYGGAHLCVLTPDGHALSITSSLNSEFGSMFTTPLGILMNNYMDAFVKPSGTDTSSERANLPGSFKTPMTSMAPVIITRKLSASPLHSLFGGSGGLAGLSAVAQLITCVSEKYYRSCVENEVRVHPELESTNFRVNVAGRDGTFEAVPMLQRYGHQVTEKFIPSTAIGIMPTREGVLMAINDTTHADGGDAGGL